jgi:hypothetical protein
LFFHENPERSGAISEYVIRIVFSTLIKSPKLTLSHCTGEYQGEVGILLR